MKLHPIAAVDRFIDSSIERKLERRLIFADENGNAVDSATFADDCTMLFWNNKLYDWYGREVVIAPGIRRIVGYYGGSCYNGDTHEQFIVEKTSGRFAIGRLKYEEQSNVKVKVTYHSLPSHKHVLTGKMLCYDPILECDSRYDFASMDTEIIKTPVFQAFIRNSGRTGLSSLAVLYDVRENGNKSMTVIRCPENNAYLGEFNDFLVLSRDEILRLSPGTEPEHGYATWLEGKIEISDNGRKMSAYRPGTYAVSAYRISTDVEVLEHLKQPHLCWYKDPA